MFPFFLFFLAMEAAAVEMQLMAGNELAAIYPTTASLMGAGSPSDSRLLA
jgi:hypothetical protein